MKRIANLFLLANFLIVGCAHDDVMKRMAAKNAIERTASLKLDAGMTVDQVRELLGEPLRTQVETFHTDTQKFVDCLVWVYPGGLEIAFKHSENGSVVVKWRWRLG